jgi:hypothetical protein
MKPYALYAVLLAIAGSSFGAVAMYEMLKHPMPGDDLNFTLISILSYACVFLGFKALGETKNTQK